MRIELRVRRFFCGNKDCGQHIFTERLPKTVERYARRTCRLSASLEQITLALGGIVMLGPLDFELGLHRNSVVARSQKCSSFNAPLQAQVAGRGAHAHDAAAG